jgi:hypothetical protein
MDSMVRGLVGAFCDWSGRATAVISSSTQKDSKRLFLFTDDLTGKIITALGTKDEFNTAERLSWRWPL